MDDDAFDEMVRRFDAVLRRDMALKDAATAVDAPAMALAAPASVGEKRSHSKAAEETPSKRGRSGSEWMLFFTNDSPKKQRYMYNIVDDRVEQYVQKGRADNLYITSVSSSGNLWALVMEFNRNMSDQVYLMSPVFLYKEWIVDKWSAGYSITAVAGNSRGKSITVMSKGTPFEQQSYRISKTFPLKWIRKKWRQGFFITSLATSGKYWAVVTSKTNIFKDQVIEMDCMYSKERFRRLQNRGLHVNALGTTQDQAVVVFSELDGPLPVQKVVYAPTFPSSQVKEQWKTNTYISGLSYGRTSNFEGNGVKFGMSRILSQPRTQQQVVHQMLQQVEQQEQQRKQNEQQAQQPQQGQQQPQQQQQGQPEEQQQQQQEIAPMEMENSKV